MHMWLLVRWIAKPTSFKEASNRKKELTWGFCFPLRGITNTHAVKPPGRHALCHVQLFIDRGVFEWSEDLRGGEYFFYSFCLLEITDVSPNLYLYYLYRFTLLQLCAVSHWVQRAQWKASFCPPMEICAMMKSVKPVSDCNVMQARVAGLRNPTLY